MYVFGVCQVNVKKLAKDSDMDLLYFIIYVSPITFLFCEDAIGKRVKEWLFKNVVRPAWEHYSIIGFFEQRSMAKHHECIVPPKHMFGTKAVIPFSHTWPSNRHTKEDDFSKS